MRWPWTRKPVVVVHHTFTLNGAVIARVTTTHLGKGDTFA